MVDDAPTPYVIDRNRGVLNIVRLRIMARNIRFREARTI